MFAKTSLPHAKSFGSRRRRPLRPALEELEPRWVPAVSPLLTPQQAVSVEVGDNDFRISNMGPDGNPNFGASDAAVAYNSVNNEYLVVWSADDNTGLLMDNEFEIFGQRLNAATGAKVGGRIRLSDMGPDGDSRYSADSPAVAYNPANNEYLVVWQGDDNTGKLVANEFEIFGQRLAAATGAEVGGDFRISSQGFDGDALYGAFNPAVAYNSVNNEYLVVWDGDSNVLGRVDEEYEISGRRVDAATGAPLDGDFRISAMGSFGDPNFGATNPAVAYNPANNEYLVVWQGDDNTAPLVNNEFEIFGQRLAAATGLQVGADDFRLSDMGPDGTTEIGAFNPAVAYNGANNEYLVVWDGDDINNNEFEIFGQRLAAATGAEVGLNDFRISDMGPDGTDDFDAFRPAVTYAGTTNEYLVVWEGNDFGGQLIEGEFEIFGQRLAAATGAEVGANDFRLSDMGPAFDDDSGAFTPAVAFNGARNEYLVVWEGDDNASPATDVDEFEIYGQRLALLEPPPAPPAPPAPPGPPQIAAVAFRRKGVARVRVTDAATGAVRGVLTPFKGFAGRLRLALRDLNGDGSLDLVAQAVVHGKRRQKVFDAVTLAPLPPGLA